MDRYRIVHHSAYPSLAQVVGELITFHTPDREYVPYGNSIIRHIGKYDIGIGDTLQIHLSYTPALCIHAVKIG